MSVPKHLLYTQDHEWVCVEKNIAVVGITFYAQRELGDVVYVELDKLNHMLRASAVFGTIEAVKTVSDLFMPVGGKIIDINKELEPHPALVNLDPYEKGWMIKIAIDKPEELKNLMDATSYESTTK